MITFDKLKIITNITNITDIDLTQFTQTFKDNKLANYKYRQNQPFHLEIMKNQKHGELAIEFSGKILLDEYPELINRTNIRKCLEHINNMGICQLDIEAIINDSHIVKCDVTKDIEYKEIKNIISDISINLKNHKKWITKEYRGGITLENVVNTSRYKKRLSVYDKNKELKKMKNNNFLAALKNQSTLLEYFKDKIRFELNINTMEQIRKLLNISNTNMQTVLNTEVNPILIVLDEAVSNEKEPEMKAQSLKEYEDMLLIKECGNNLDKVEAVVRALVSRNTSVTRTMKRYTKLFKLMQASTEIQHSDWIKLLSL